MPIYVFSQGTIRVEQGVYSPKREKRLSDFGVLILVPPKLDGRIFGESTQDKGQSNDEQEAERPPK